MATIDFFSSKFRFKLQKGYVRKTFANLNMF